MNQYYNNNHNNHQGRFLLKVSVKYFIEISGQKYFLKNNKIQLCIPKTKTVLQKQQGIALENLYKQHHEQKPKFI